MSAADTRLVLDSDTGIDVSPHVAGPGARALAFVTDWHIRAIAAAAWWVTASVFVNGALLLGPPVAHDTRWFYIVILPAMAIGRTNRLIASR